MPPKNTSGQKDTDDDDDEEEDSKKATEEASKKAAEEASKQAAEEESKQAAEEASRQAGQDAARKQEEEQERQRQEALEKTAKENEEAQKKQQEDEAAKAAQELADKKQREAEEAARASEKSEETVTYKITANPGSFSFGEAPAGKDRDVATASPAEGGKVTGGGTFAINQGTTLRAVSNPGYTFIGWEVNGQIVNRDATVKISRLEEDYKCTAITQSDRSLSGTSIFPC